MHKLIALFHYHNAVGVERDAALIVAGEGVFVLLTGHEEVHPTIEKSAVYVLELDLSFLEQLSIRDIKAKEITKFPTVTKDMAFAVSREVTCEEILNVMKKAGGRILKSISVFDVYEGENVGKDEKSIAFSLTFEDATKTLTDDEVMEVFNKIVENVTEKCHATLRDK